MKPEVISELVVNVEPQEMSIAVLEDKNLVELQKEARNLQFAVFLATNPHPLQWTATYAVRKSVIIWTSVPGRPHSGHGRG